MQQNAGSDIFKNSPKHFQNNLAFQVGKFEDDVESGLELMSSELMSTPRMPGSTIESGLPESLDLDTDKTIEGEFQSLDFITDLEMDSPKLAKDKELEAARTEVNLLMSTVTQAALEIRSDVKEMLPDLTPTPDSKTPLSEFKQFLESQESEKNKQESEVKEWVKPLLAGKCLQERKFWKSEEEKLTSPTGSSGKSSPSFNSNSASSNDKSKSALNSPRSPLTALKAMSPSGSIQSLPSSPVKGARSSSVRKLTSESFSSENDISRSLEIVYVQPESSPIEQLTAAYRTASPSLGRKFEKRKPSFTQLRRPPSNELRSDSPDKYSESDIPSSASPDYYEMSQTKSADFTPFVSDIEPLKQKNALSPTKIIAPSKSCPTEQVSSEILSPILDIKSQTPLRSPEKKFEYVQGLKESLEDSFEIIKPDSPSGSEPQALSSSDEDDEDSSPASPRSPSPKVSPGSPKPSSHSSGSSSGASSHGSSHEDLEDLKDRELLDEMIVKDVPEVSTDPVRQFEDSNHSSNPIDSIPEDTDQLENQCKDLIDNDKGNNISKSSFNDPSSSIHSSDPILEMPSKEEETSPTCGLAAPDSKDSLEVQLYSVCDDISENLSGKEESMEDLKAGMDKQDSSQSEDEKNSIIDDTKPRPDEPIAGREKECIEQAVQEIKVQAMESSIVGSVAESLEIKYAETNGVNKDESFEIVEVDDVENKMPVHLESDVSAIDEAKKIVEEVKVEALNEVKTESEKQIDVVDESSKMTEVMEIFEKIESGEVSADPVKAESNSYQTTVKKIETKVSVDDECVAVTAYQTGTITQTTTVEKKIEDQSSIDDTDEEEIKQTKN